MKELKFALVGIAAAVVVASALLGLAEPASAADGSDPAVAGLTTDGSIYVAGDDGLWHQTDSAALAADGLGGDTITWYGELPGTVGDPVATVTRTTQSGTTTTSDLALAGLTADGSVYVAGDDGLWHYIDGKTFAARGLDANAITWYGDLPGDVGDAVPAA